MRLVLLVGALLVAGCASTPVNDNQPVARACSVSQCFRERDIRDFEVIGRTTLIVYVGAQRCPFKIELRGTFCDMTFAPDLNFHKNDISQRTAAENIFGTQTFGQQTSGDDRICSNDIQVSVDGGVFTEGSADTDQLPIDPTNDNRTIRRIERTGTVDSEGRRIDRFGNRESLCQVSDVESLTDDSLVELYVKRGVVPPPPPIGQGQITVGPQSPPPPVAPPTGESENAPPTPPANAAGPSAATAGGHGDPETSQAN